MRVLVYRLDRNSLQIRVVLFPEHKKMLKEMVVRIALSMNANTKNSQVKQSPCCDNINICCDMMT